MRAAAKIGDSHGARVDAARARFDFLAGQKRIVNAFPLEIAVAHHLRSAEHLGVEAEGTLHILHREAKMLHALQAKAEGEFVGLGGRGRSRPLRVG